MRVSGRKLRLAVGTGIASLMLVLGVTSVGAAAPGTVGNVNVVVTSSSASGISSTNTSVTAANFRDAVVITNTLSGTGGLSGGNDYNDCMFSVTGNPDASFNAQGKGGNGNQPNGDTGVTDTTPYICGATNPIIEPAAYPLWEIQTGTAINGRGTSQILVVPPTENRPNGTAPGKTYLINTFR